MGKVRVEVVRNRRADRTTSRVRRAEHEVVDHQLGATVEEVREGLRPSGRLEAVLLLDSHPGKLSALSCQLIRLTGMCLLLGEQLVAGRLPLLLRCDLVLRHRLTSCVRCTALCLRAADSAMRLIAASRASQSAATWASERVAASSRCGRIA